MYPLPSVHPASPARRHKQHGLAALLCSLPPWGWRTRCPCSPAQGCALGHPHVCWATKAIGEARGSQGLLRLSMGLRSGSGPPCF